MGKPIKSSAMVKTIGNHYEVVEFEITYKAASNGTNCAIMVNGKQAAAGVSYDKKSGEAQPSKDECAKVADLAHTAAANAYAAHHPEKTLPKKLSADTIRGS